MPLKIIQQNHWQIIGEGAVLLSNPPSEFQTGDLYAGRIVEEAALVSRAHALIIKEGTRTTDLLPIELAIKDFQSTTVKIIEEFEIKCVLEILGQAETGIEVRGVQKESGSAEAVDMIKNGFEGDFDLRINYSEPNKLPDSASKIQTVSVLLGPEERGSKKDLLISKLAVAVGLLNAKLGHVETDERTSSTLN